MTRVFVLFNLKEGVSEADYEAWAKATDIPNVRALKSVDGFEVFKSTGLMGGDGTPPYAYFEIIDVNDMEQLGDDASSEAMQKVAGEFQALADNPVFIVTENLEGAAV
ncbi:MAG: REDY-like protein HapK [Pseudomonadota bacterium]